MGRWKKIRKIGELIDEKGNPIYYKNYNNIDLCGVDLSTIPPSFWEGASFDYANFSNTNIKFYPRKLYKWGSNVILNKCNFENCDLSYLEDQDLVGVIFQDCNLRNTNLKVDFSNTSVFSKSHNVYQTPKHPNIGERVYLKGTILPDSYQDVPFDYFDYVELDIKFLELNPHIKVSSAKLYEIIQKELPSKYSVRRNYIEERKKFFLHWLKRDEEGILKRFYEQMKPYFEKDSEEDDFYNGFIDDKRFKELDLTYMNAKMLTTFLIGDSVINKLKINVSYKEFNDEHATDEHFRFIESTPVTDLYMPVSLHDWDNNGVKRLGESNITFFTNLYLELGRTCNMCCAFCRNVDINPASYDLDKIVNNLKLIIGHINHLVIGGGEPTLKVDDLISLKKELSELDKIRNELETYINTNGSLNIEEYYRLMVEQNYKFYFSRHHYDEEENRRIFKDKNGIILKNDDLERLNLKDSTITCTCFKSGIKSVDDILRYIDFAINLGFENILIQNTHQEKGSNKSLSINPTIFHDSIKNLLRQDYGILEPVFSNSNYILYRLSKGRINITFKKYIKHEDLLPLWNTAQKRCFDLSMNPAGEVFETWDQSGKPIKRLSRFN